MGFRAVVAPAVTGRTVVRVAAASLCRLHVNGAFRGHGPARGPHDSFLADEWELTDQLARPGNMIAIEVVGYKVNAYYLLDDVPLCADDSCPVHNVFMRNCFPCAGDLL